MIDVRPFRLSATFLQEFENKQPEWGPLGYITYRRTYSRLKDDGTQEEFWETCKRVVEGCYNIQKNHCHHYNLTWDNQKAQKSAQEMFKRMWDFKWLPPGRGLWMMGTSYIHERTSACLFNCGFVSTKDINSDFSEPFCWMMDMLMLGVGVGFDTKGSGVLKIVAPKQGEDVFVVEDSREGWVSLLRRVLTSYSGKGSLPADIDYSLVRLYGEPIKGFGGTSSGPQPLIELIKDIQDILDTLVGKTITSTAIVDIANLIGRCVVAGNVRRSAELVLGEYTDQDFLNLKNPDINQEALTHHRWASNNSILAESGMDYSSFADMTIKNGEPGYVWLDNCKKFSRTKDIPDWKDRDVAGVNPCVTSDTWIQTDEGTIQVKDLIGKKFNAVVSGNSYCSGDKGFWYTGHKPVYKVETDHGFAFKATKDHLVATDRGWVAVKDLLHTDKLCITNNRSLSLKSNSLDFSKGYLLGHLKGDGCIFNNNNVKFSVWAKDGPGIEGMKRTIIESINTCGIKHRSDWKGWTYNKINNNFNLRSRKVFDLLASYGLDTQKNVDFTAIEKESDSFCVGYLRGLFDTDGSVQGTQKKGVSVRLSQSDSLLLESAQRLLIRFGILSKLYYNRTDFHKSLLPDGCGGSRLYDCHPMHELVISNESINSFVKIIGFSHTDKLNKVNNLLSSYHRKLNKDKFLSRVKKVTYLGEEDVYDAEVKIAHMFSANGVLVHNCSEITLSSHELCNLCEVFPSKHENYLDFQKTLKLAYLYSKTVTLLPTHNERTNQVMMKNRRIGTSLSGISQAIKKHGRRSFLNWCDKGYSYLKDLDKEYSDWLCIRESIKISTVKPSGSISLLPGVTPGIHYPHSEYYIRRIRFQEGHPIVNELRSNGFAVEKDQYSPNTVVVSFPVKEEYFDRSKTEVSMWEQLELAAQMQYWWADNSVSCTITFKDSESSDIKYALELYENRLKSISFLPLKEHGYVQAPYEEITEQEYNSMNDKIINKSFNSINHDITEKFCDGDVCIIK